MAGKMTFLMVFAVLGFIGGIAANWAYRQLQPMIAAVLKDVLITDLLLSGMGGALITVFIVLIWANFSQDR
jgi:hypothetical protein